MRKFGGYDIGLIIIGVKKMLSKGLRGRISALRGARSHDYLPDRSGMLRSGHFALYPARDFIQRFLSYLLLFVAAEIAITQASFASDKQVVGLKQTEETACPSQNFPAFLSAYANNETIQRTFLRIPLKMQRLDLDAEPEPKPVVNMLKYEQIKFPLFPLRAERDAKLLAMRIDKLSKKKAEVTLFKQDTDYQVTYFFVKKECWVLTAIEDWSM